MFLPILVAFEFLFIVPMTSQNQDLVLRDVIIDNKVIGVLGEDVYLHCLYTGKHDISGSSWKRLDSGNRAKMMAGYKNGKLFAKENFSTPASHTNLTVKVHINSFEVEGQYTCVFSTDEEEMMGSLFLHVIARPIVNSHADEEILNGTHYQKIFCSASYAKPTASLHWEIQGTPPNENIFSIINTNVTLPNGTISIASMLHFPIHLNNESSVACVIQHPTLIEPSTTIIDLQTFVFPNITMDMVLIEKEGDNFFEVSCRAKGGRPHPSITWIDLESETTCSPRSNEYGSVFCSRCFPLAVYEGKNITCIFGYPHLPATVRAVTLPTYYLTSLQLRNSSIKINHFNTSNLLILEEGDSDIKINMQVMGNVPRYKINCIKDGGPLLEDVNVVGSGLIIKGPVGTNQTGQYQCQASYYRHTASLKIELKVKPKVQSQAPVHVTLLSNTSWENGIEYIIVKCMAENVSPSTNITWETRECKGEIIESVPENVHSGNHQDHSGVWNSARLPVYSYAGCTLTCVVHHQELKEPVKKSIYIPITVRPPRSYISVGLLTDSTHWSAVCKANGSITNISWFISDTDATTLPITKNFTKEGSKELTSCIYKFELCQHEGKFLICAVQNKFGDLERRTIHVPHFFISSVSVLNKTVPLHGHHKQHTGVHRVVLKEHVPNQKILFQVKGNASKFHFKCFRPDGLSAHTIGMALIFAQQVSESDAGLYTCSASWCHHNASIRILVEVIGQKIHSMILILICFSSAVAITLIMMVTLCIFCKRNQETHSSKQDRKKRDSLAALMQDPRSPELKKIKGQHQEYAELVNYSIVIDVKSTV